MATTLGAWVEITGLQSASGAPHNGRLAMVVGAPAEDSGRIPVQLLGLPKTLSVKAANLKAAQEGAAAPPEMSEHAAMVLEADAQHGGALWVGDLLAANSAQWLTEVGIGARVNCAAEVPVAAEVSDAYLHVPLRDHHTESIEDHWQGALEFIDAALRRGAGVLVHCVQGRSRSVAIVLAYMLRQRRGGESLKACWHHVKQRREAAEVNMAFMMSLMRLEHELCGTSSMDMVEQAVGLAMSSADTYK